MKVNYGYKLETSITKNFLLLWPSWDFHIYPEFYRYEIRLHICLSWKCMSFSVSFFIIYSCDSILFSSYFIIGSFYSLILAIYFFKFCRVFITILFYNLFTDNTWIILLRFIYKLKAIFNRKTLLYFGAIIIILIHLFNSSINTYYSNIL